MYLHSWRKVITGTPQPYRLASKRKSLNRQCRTALPCAGLADVCGWLIALELRTPKLFAAAAPSAWWRRWRRRRPLPKQWI